MWSWSLHHEITALQGCVSFPRYGCHNWGTPPRDSRWVNLSSGEIQVDEVTIQPDLCIALLKEAISIHKSSPVTYRLHRFQIHNVTIFTIEVSIALYIRPIWWFIESAKPGFSRPDRPDRRCVDVMLEPGYLSLEIWFLVDEERTISSEICMINGTYITGAKK